jgi:hypothetical protein
MGRIFPIHIRKAQEKYKMRKKGKEKAQEKFKEIAVMAQLH